MQDYSSWSCLGHVLQDILHATSPDVVTVAQVDPFVVLRGNTNERETHISVRTLQTVRSE